MFDLEQAIAEWRRSAITAGIEKPALLEELENHLREDFHALVTAGMPEARAFQLATAHLGSSGHLQTEFSKLKKPCGWPVTIASWLYLGAMFSFAALFSNQIITGRKRDLILCVQTLSLVAGYAAGVFAGSFGILYVRQRLFGALCLNRQPSLHRAVLLFSQLAAALTITGMVLGMIWSYQHHEGFFAGGMNELGAFGVICWYVAASLMQRSGRMGERAAMLVCITGNIIVSLTWFLPAAMLHADLYAHGVLDYLPVALAVFVGLNALFLAIGLMIGLAARPEKAQS